MAPDVKTAIQQAVGAGRVAFVSQHDVVVGTWRGTGYIFLDPETGSGAYIISGNLNGGLLGVAWALGALVAIMFLGSVALVAFAATAGVALSVILTALTLAMVNWSVGIFLTATILNSPAVSKEEKQCFLGGFSYSLPIASIPILEATPSVALILTFIVGLFSTGSTLVCVFGKDIP